MELNSDLVFVEVREAFVFTVTYLEECVPKISTTRNSREGAKTSHFNKRFARGSRLSNLGAFLSEYLIAFVDLPQCLVQCSAYIWLEHNFRQMGRKKEGTTQFRSLQHTHSNSSYFLVKFLSDRSFMSLASIVHAFAAIHMNTPNHHSHIRRD